ncbi:hypothetical protein Anapl_03689 [Anas platyrhynchos]|uniref:Uncharacterized protein n=1 Tax=Anas platyrhynchos TaxID=8839 RepID=R0K9J7_ANAPL|nr:hypothetical protein Anapl_03689 [Anas platyrhynchos]
MRSPAIRARLPSTTWLLSDSCSFLLIFFTSWSTSCPPAVPRVCSYLRWEQIANGQGLAASPGKRQAVEAVGQQGGYAGLGDNLVCEPSAAPHGLDLLFGLQNSNKSACHKQGGAALYQDVAKSAAPAAMLQKHLEAGAPAAAHVLPRADSSSSEDGSSTFPCVTDPHEPTHDSRPQH